MCVERLGRVVHVRGMRLVQSPSRALHPTIATGGFLLLATVCTLPALRAESWSTVQWQGEQAYALETPAWRAIVSVERARLVHFGPVGQDTNLVAVTPAKNGNERWGGHSVWLGPQLSWARFWPPLPAWEWSVPDDVTSVGPRLTLTLPDAGDGWPRISRVYELVDGELACRVELAAGGTRAVQIMQVLQTLLTAEVEVPIVASPAAPLGCLLLPPFGGRRELTPLVEPLPDFLTRDGDVLRIRHATRLDKFAFPPSTLVARHAGFALRVSHGESVGRIVGAPEGGFYTQVCPGDNNLRVLELEQMSPLFAAGEAAAFTMRISLAAN
jgi:hypothetical protein